MPKSNRFQIPALGEWHAEILSLDAWISNRSAPAQAKTLLLSKLQEREVRIGERLEHLAKRRGIDPDDMRIQILSGKAQRLSPSEWLDEDDSQDGE